VQSLEPIEERIADVNSFIVVVLEILKIVAVRKVNFGRWPLSRRTYKASILVHQRNKFSLPKTRKAFQQKFICAIVAKNIIKVIWCVRNANFFLISDLGQNEIDRLMEFSIWWASTVARLPVLRDASAIASERSHQIVRAMASAALQVRPIATTMRKRNLGWLASVDMRLYQFVRNLFEGYTAKLAVSFKVTVNCLLA
jgi:hypothetical protein